MTYSIHKFKILVVKYTARARQRQPATEAFSKVWNCPWVNWMQFKQVIVLLFNQGVNASKTSKSFKNRADLFVIVGKLTEIPESAHTIKDCASPLNLSGKKFQGSKMTELRRSEPKS